MSASKTFETSILLTGSESPQLAKAMASGAAKLQQISKLVNQTSKQFAGMSGSADGLSPALQRAKQHSDRLGDSLRRVSEIGAGVAIGDLIAGGLERAIGFADQLLHKFAQFSEESSKVAANRELMSKGIGNILGNQALADQIMKREADLAILSPFQATDLQQTVKRYIAAGADPKTAEWLTKRSGDIVAGVGGRRTRNGTRSAGIREDSSRR
jgi:hypothetical protein